jgi:hypothetical protein
MASTYSPSLRIELIGAGEQAGTWNTTTNSNLGTIIESAIAGYVAVSVTSANQAFTALDGAPDQARNAVIALTTTTTAAFAVYAPPQEKTYVIYNTTAYTATVYNSTVLGNTTAAGLGVAVAAGGKVAMFSDGTNFRTTDAGSFSGILPVANGGTGVATSTGTGNTVLSTSPTLVTPILGTPASGALDNCTSNTETFGTSNTQLATTAFVQAAFQALHPVGSIYINATNATNPGTLLGFGTWTAFGAGRVPVGFNAGNPLFDTAEETGGSADSTLPTHTHTATSTVTDPSHSHALMGSSSTGTTRGLAEGSSRNVQGGDGTASRGYVQTAPNGGENYVQTSATGITVSTSVTSAGSSGTNTNYQPYITVYMWKRTV